MLKQIYKKYGEPSVKINDIAEFKDYMKFILPGSKIKWRGEKRRYKCIARSDNFIIVVKPFNLKKDYDGEPIVQYSIFDLNRMMCNRDNLVFGIYNYAKEEDCKEALEALEAQLIYEQIPLEEFDNYPEYYKKLEEDDLQRRRDLVKKANEDISSLSEDELLEYINFPSVICSNYAMLKDTLEISERGICKIEDIVEEIWIEMTRS